MGENGISEKNGELFLDFTFTRPLANKRHFKFITKLPGVCLINLCMFIHFFLFANHINDYTQAVANYTKFDILNKSKYKSFLFRSKISIMFYVSKK